MANKVEEEKPVETNKIQPDNKKKNIKRIIMALLFLIMLGFIAAIFMLLSDNFNISSIISSGNSGEFKNYYAALKKYEDSKYYQGYNSLLFHAYKIVGMDDTVVSVEYIVDDSYTTSAIYYKKDGNIVEKTYDHEAVIDALFNTDKEEYGYWLIEKTNGKIIYTLLDDIVKENSKLTQYTFKESENYSSSENGKTTKITPTEEHFISYNNGLATEFVDKDELNKFKRYLKRVIKDAVSADQTLLSKNDYEVKEKLSEIRKQQKEVKEYNETITVGSHKLKLGTYTGRIQNMDGSYGSVKVVLKKSTIVVDGTETKYTIRGKFIIVYDFEMFQIDRDNEMVYLAGECPTLKYKG